MTATDRAIGVVKSVLLFKERLEGVQKELAQLRTDLSVLSRDVISVDRRVTHIEGVMDGYQRASTQRPRPRLPNK